MSDIGLGRIPGMQVETTNVAEHGTLHKWWWAVLPTALGIFAVINAFAWLTMIEMWKRTWWIPMELWAAIIVLGLGITFGFPALCVSFGFAIGRVQEYNRMLDSMALAATSSAQMHSHANQSSQAITTTLLKLLLSKDILKEEEGEETIPDDSTMFSFD